MRMARVNIYLPDELAQEARDAHLNISGLTQDAVRRALDRAAVGAWIDATIALPPVQVDQERLLAALDAARDEFGTAGR